MFEIFSVVRNKEQKHKVSFDALDFCDNLWPSAQIVNVNTITSVGIQLCWLKNN